VVCSGEHGNKISACIKYEKCIDHTRNSYAFKRDDLAFTFYKHKMGSKEDENGYNYTCTPSVSMA